MSLILWIFLKFRHIFKIYHHQRMKKLNKYLLRVYTWCQRDVWYSAVWYPSVSFLRMCYLMTRNIFEVLWQEITTGLQVNYGDLTSHCFILQPQLWILLRILLSKINITILSILPPPQNKEFLCSPVARACATATEDMGDTGSIPGAGNKIKSCMLCSATYI